MDQKSQEQMLVDYYKLNMKQMNISFWASLGALSIGLVALVAGVVLAFSGDVGLEASLAAAGGVLTQFIGAGYFFLYSRNLRQLNVFYEKLIKHQDTMYAIGLVNHLPEEMKGAMLQTVISNLLMRNEPKFPMSPELAKVIADAMHAERNKI